MTSGPFNPNYAPAPQAQPGYGQQPYPYAPQSAYPPGYGYPPGYPGGFPAAAPAHGGVGIASFILGLVAGIAMFVLIVIAGVMAADAPGGQLDENSTEAMTVGCSLIVAAGMAVLGLILGIVGSLQQGSKKVFPVLGIVINGGMMLLVIGLMVLGAAMG
jgi:hypothetical protein